MRLFVGNLDYRVDEARVERFLAAHKITALSFVILRDAEKMSKCCGFLRVSDDQIEKTLKLNGKMIEARPLTIKRSGDTAKQGRKKRL